MKSKQFLIIMLLAVNLCPAVWAAGLVRVTETKTVTEYTTGQEKADTDENRSNEAVGKQTGKQYNSIALNAGYFMPLSEKWADAVLPVAFGNITMTAPETAGEDAKGASFSVSFRLGYMYQMERGVNEYRDHRFYVSLPLNLNIAVFEKQTLTLGTGCYFGFNYTVEKSVHTEEWNFDTKSSFGFETFVRFSYKLCPSFILNLEINSLIPLINRDYIAAAVTAGIGYRF